MKRTRGFTLVELMIGLAVGLFVSAVAISVYVSTRKLQSINASGNRMGENSRLAFELLQKDLRGAGFQGCAQPTSSPPDTVLNAGNGGFLDSGTSGVMGYEGTGTGFGPALPAALSALSPAPLVDSDVLSVRVPVDSLSLGLVANFSVPSAAPAIASGVVGNTLAQGDIVMLSNCNQSLIFQVTEAAPAATGLLSHSAGGGFSPGNSVATLPKKFDRSDSSIFRLQTHHYYVANSLLHPGTKALWRLTVQGSGAGEEVAAGVDRLVVTYGLDTNADRSVDRYASASVVDTGSAWGQVLAVRVQMLVATTQDNMARSAQTVEFAGSGVVGADKRLREALTEVVSLRSRTP